MSSEFVKGEIIWSRQPRNWYIVKTNPQCERKAAGELRRAGLRVYLPKHSYTHQHKRTGIKKTVHRPLWVGYLLVRFPEVASGRTPPFAIARACQGVKEFVTYRDASGDERPFAVPDKIIMGYMRRQRAHDYDGEKMQRALLEQRRSQFAKGKTVRINDGVFAGFLGKIDKLDGDIAHLFIEMFGRETVVHVDDFLKSLEPVAKRPEAA